MLSLVCIQNNIILVLEINQALHYYFPVYYYIYFHFFNIYDNILVYRYRLVESTTKYRDSNHCASSYEMVLRHKSYADCLVNQSEIPFWGQKSSMLLCMLSI